MTTTRAALHLLTLRWHDLTDTLGAPTARAWYGTGIRHHLATDEQPEPALSLRALERDPAQIGERPIPIRLDVYETMRAITTDMRDTADVIASRIQVAPMVAEPHGITLPPAKAARRRAAAARDAADPRRWPIGAALPLETAVDWLVARVEGAPGPFRLLNTADHDTIRASVRTALWRAEQALDRGAHAELTLALPCPRCGGQVTMRGGAAACGGCRSRWTVGGELTAA
ncbi:hypothetical protein ACF068_14640 [Streptomyces sp. NPDC016309]|uniref:hypothetical protein n=1 Tax=Streptomyces sp. NPDC016309 TaxID=3364965 RepID=UPI0036FFCD37